MFTQLGSLALLYFSPCDRQHAVLRAKWTGKLMPNLYCDPSKPDCDPDAPIELPSADADENNGASNKDDDKDNMQGSEPDKKPETGMEIAVASGDNVDGEQMLMAPTSASAMRQNFAFLITLFAAFIAICS